MKIRLLFIALLVSMASWGQATLPVTRTDWDTTPIGWTDTPLDFYLTTYACTESNGARFDTTGDSKIINFAGTPGQLSFVVKSNTSASTSVLLVEESADGSTYTNVISLTGTSGLPTSCSTKGTYNLDSGTRYIRWSFTKGSSNMTLDDVSITTAAPTITLSSTILSDFTYVFGNGPSSTQAFSVGGNNLTADITLTAPIDYEISLALGSGFGSSLSLIQSGGTVVMTTIYVRLKSGLSEGSYDGENIAVTSTGVITQNVTCSGTVTTALKPGDLAILAVNIDMGSGTDQIAFVCFEDVLIGTTIYLTDNGYGREFTGEWGGTEGLLSITRTGSTLTKGTITVIQTNHGNVTSESQYDVYTCGAIDANWTKTALGGGSISGFNLNVDDDLWIMQGGTWTNNTSHHSTYNGTVLYGWTQSGWDSDIGNGVNGTKWSNLFDGLECFTVNAGGNEKVKFNDPIDSDFTTSTNGQYDWIILINEASNWNAYDDATYIAGGYDYKNAAICPAMTIAENTRINGKWTGNKDSNWFDCNNWDTLAVPDETVDVLVGDNAFNRQAIVDNTADYAHYFGNIAKAKNLTISGESVEITASPDNKLEVHGDLTLETNGLLDMNDDTIAEDGQLYLLGNWTNSIGNSTFEEGNGTVYFKGSTPQIINNVTPEGTEIFYNLILDNDFDTTASNDIIANGDLILNTNKVLTIGAGDYVKIQNNLTVETGAVVDIAHEGSLVMIDDSGTVTNNGTLYARKTTTPYEIYDYTYWSSPMTNIPIANALSDWKTDYIFKFETANFSDIYTNGTGDATPDTFDDNNDSWVYVPQTTIMSPGKGYIAMAPTSGTFPATAEVTFTGTVNNGVIITPIVLSGNPASATDDFNLIGNPYPSAIFADDLINSNMNISGTLYFWTHVGNISAANPGSQLYNFKSDDYALYNLTGGTRAAINTNASSGLAGVPTGYIASGQGFFVEAETAGDVIFNNAMRKTGFNNNFYKNSNKGTIKDRIWISLQNDSGMYSQQLVGYIPESTLGYDRGYDGLRAKAKTYVHFYSHSDNEEFKIQSRGDFDSNDIVKLGYQTEYAGQFKIKMDGIEGILNTPDVNVFIEDKLLNIIHDLKLSDYAFNTEIGKFDNRFALRYTHEALNNHDFENIASKVIVVTSNQEIKIKSESESIKNIAVYDILGRLLFEKDNINNKQFSIQNIALTRQVLILKIVLENNQTITRKTLT